MDNIHDNHKEQAFYTVVDLYLDEYTSKDDKAKLKVMYDELASNLSIDTTKKDSALAQFVADPEKCFSKIINLVNQGKHGLDTDTSTELDLKNLYKSIDLETLEKLSEVGKKLEEHQPEAKSSSIASKIGIALAVTQELNKLGHSKDSNLQSEGPKKFTETILNMRLHSKGSSGLAK